MPAIYYAENINSTTMVFLQYAQLSMHGDIAIRHKLYAHFLKKFYFKKPDKKENSSTAK